MPARTDLDRLTAARPAVLHRTEDVVDATTQDHILHHILTSAPDAPVPDGDRPQDRTRSTRRRLAGHLPRRVILGVTAAAAVIVAVALTLTMLVPAAHRAPRPGGRVQLTAWTVTKLAGGDIRVQINQLRDPAGLQRKLRADGVPASVTFIASPNPACRPYPASQALLDRVFPGSYQLKPPPGGVIVIHVASLPGNAGVHLAGQFGAGAGGVQAPLLVYASQQCTGS